MAQCRNPWESGVAGKYRVGGDETGEVDGGNKAGA